MPTPSGSLSEEAIAFYRRALERLKDRNVPFLVGGAYAFARYTGIVRHTKDLDLFLLRRDLERAFEALDFPGCRVEHTAEHWLAKVYCGDHFVDLIYSSGNGVSVVTEDWFERAPEDEVMGVPVRLCAPEDILWPKAFVQDRERYDGADVAHLLLKADLDWEVVLRHFDPHWRVLLAHLVLFGFSYPSERSRIPRWVMDELLGRMYREMDAPPSPDRVCRGTLVSRAQYLVDVDEWGYHDGRLLPDTSMTTRDVEAWTEAIEKDGPDAPPPSH